MSGKNEKKLRRLTRQETSKAVHEALPGVAAHTVLSMRRWPWRDRLKFAAWLLWGRGAWKGFEG